MIGRQFEKPAGAGQFVEMARGQAGKQRTARQQVALRPMGISELGTQLNRPLTSWKNAMLSKK
jgi:hypothetical protein